MRTCAYILGGKNDAEADTKLVVQIIFSNDTAAAVNKGNVLDAARAASFAAGFYGGKVYCGLGLVDGSRSATSEAFSVAQDTVASVAKGNYTAARSQGAGTQSDSAIYGAGGDDGSYVKIVDTLACANDTASAIAKGDLPANIHAYPPGVSA